MNQELLQSVMHDIDLHSHHGRRYLPSVKPGAHLRVAVGLLSTEGYFAPIAHSSLQRASTPCNSSLNRSRSSWRVSVSAAAGVAGRAIARVPKVSLL